MSFHTEPKLALEMITALIERAVLPFRWVTCDARYGEIPVFLDKIAALQKWYFAQVAVDTRVWLHTPSVEPPGPGLLGRPRLYPRVKRTAPPPYEMRELVALVPATQWHRHLIKEGSKGPQVAEFACIRVTPFREGLPGSRCWAIFRRTLGAQSEVKFFLSNATTTCSLQDFARISGLRWPIETGLKESKGEVGMDQYETRTWLGWHHQMAHSLLAHLFLVRLQIVFQKKSRFDHCPSASTHCTCHRRRACEIARHPGGTTLSTAPKLCCLLFSSQANASSTGSLPVPIRQTRIFVIKPYFSL